MKVILCEKPSVARDIARVLKANQRMDGYFEGNGLQITWAFGHLILLSNPDKYDSKFEKWEMNDIPIIPKTFLKEISTNDGVKKQFETIRELLNKESTTEVVCATDAGREGELIFRYIYEASECQKPIYRLWISSQTDSAIKEGFGALKTGEHYQTLYDSARSRAEADWLVGINATRAYTIRFSRGDGVMSVGRVQTPVLNMICQRYREHTEFNAQPYFEVWGTFDHPNGKYQAKMVSDNQDRFDTAEKANLRFDAIKAETKALIADMTEKEKIEHPPLLYDLTELQKDCNRQLKLSAENTLAIAQSLYEKHKILTYPRTSSRYLSQDLVPKLPQLLDNLTGYPGVADALNQVKASPLTITKRLVDDAKITDHHAIILTDKKPDLSQLNDEERAVFDLVARRFLAAFMPDCIKTISDLRTQVKDEVFRATGMMIKQAGWRSLYLDAAPEDKKKRGKKAVEPSEDDTVLPFVQKGEMVKIKKLEVQEKKTKAPALHTEASILSFMETAGKNIDEEELREAMKDTGLGTPATRAQILERLLKVGYIVRDKQKLIPTQKGLKLIGCIQNEALLSPELTGQWEKKLQDIFRAKYDRVTYMTEIEQFTKKVVDEVRISTTNPYSAHLTPLGKCPLCGGKVLETPKAYGCDQWKATGCKFVIWKEVAKLTLPVNLVKQLLESGKSDLIDGFVSKKGSTFKAGLKLESDGKVGFWFES